MTDMTLRRGKCSGVPITSLWRSGDLAFRTPKASTCLLDFFGADPLFTIPLIGPLAFAKSDLRGRAVARKIADQVDVAIGERIRRFRQSANLSPAELGKRIGASSQQIRKYESGEDRVGVGPLMQIAAALDVPIMDFFGRVSPRGWTRQQAVRLSTTMTVPRADDLLRAFLQISDRSMQSAIIDVAHALRQKTHRRKR